MLKDYHIVPLSSFSNDYTKFTQNHYFETIFLDEFIFNHAILFYNFYFGYNQHPISKEEAFLYAQLGTRINADFFKSIRPRDEQQLNMFYTAGPFHFFNNIIRFMDGMHRSMMKEFLDRQASPILDFGGGTGGISIFLAKNGLDVTFVESNLICLEWMRYITRQCNLKIDVLSSTDKINKKFKLIIAKDIMEHVVNPDSLKNYLSSLMDSTCGIFMSHFPCCGPDDMAPMHFKLDVKKNEKKDAIAEFLFSEQDNLEYLKNGQYPIKPSDSNKV